MLRDAIQHLGFQPIVICVYLPQLHVERVTEDVWILHHGDPPAGPADLQRIDGTTPICTGLPPQPHPKRLIKRDTLPPLGPAWKGSCWLMLCNLAARQKITQIGPLSTIRYTERTLERRGRPLDTICVFWQVIEVVWRGGMVDGDVSCHGLISLSCLLPSPLMDVYRLLKKEKEKKKQRLHVTSPAEVDSLCWMYVRGKLL